MTGCNYYLNGSSFAPIEEKAKARLMSKEGIEFDNVTKSTPETTEKALPKFKERDVETVKKIFEATIFLKTLTLLLMIKT